MIEHLATVSDSSGYDRELMGDEVLIHRHMLHDLKAARSQSTGAVQQFVNETIPIVQRHLNDAEAIRARLGDKSGGTR